MPIEGLSGVQGLPRVGKIHLGIMVTKDGKTYYPQQTDYFVVPDSIKQYVGDKPKVLDIQFPVDDPALFAPQFLKCYGQTFGLLCIGDGKQAKRKIDTKTGDIASSTTETWEFKPWTCDRETCIQYKKGQCRQVMNLYFVMQKVPGVGVWQLDTGSTNSIKNVNNVVGIILQLCGGIRWLPLRLALVPRDVTPIGERKKTVQVLEIQSLQTIVQLKALVPPERQIEAPKEPDEEEPADTEETDARDVEAGLVPPRVIYGETVTKSSLTQAQREKMEAVVKEAVCSPTPAPRNDSAAKQPEEDPDWVKLKSEGEQKAKAEAAAAPWKSVTREQLKDLNALYRLCAQYFKIPGKTPGKMVPMSSMDVIKELGYQTQRDMMITETPWDCWLKIVASKEQAHG